MFDDNGISSSSFRDPSGFLFYKDNVIYRQINTIYKENYDHLMESGLYESLTNSRLLIPHEEVEIDYAKTADAYKTIKPTYIPFISYPYEWCFSQLKDAALTTLEIQKKALSYGMSLKDSSAYNIQFFNGKPILLDSLSFEKYIEHHPWVAYRQFCQHFLAPLALMSIKDIRLNQLLRIYIDGIPLDLACSILPFRSMFRLSLFSHLYVHAKTQKFFAGKTVNVGKEKKMSRLSVLGLIDNLETAIKKLKWCAKGTEWGDYYEDTNYSADALNHKKQLVDEFIRKISPKTVWDMGSNIGTFSRISSCKGIQTISFDIDPACVESNYLESVKENETHILSLLMDLTNPSSGIGWDHSERVSLVARGPADTVLALALIHHLTISNNLPFSKVASFFNSICNSLIIEFVPKNDSQVQRLLSTRDDIFTDYTPEVFESKFSEHFDIENKVGINDSERILYLMKSK